MKANNWLFFTLITTVLWGVWGAYTDLPTKYGFPETLIYVVWALTMVPVALIALKLAGWKIKRDRRSVLLGMIIGLLGAGGQMLLFHTVKIGATYMIFPIISLSPGVTIILSYFLLKERTGLIGKFGIFFAMCSLPLFDMSLSQGFASIGLWFILSLAIMLAWGVQAYFIKLANATMEAESIFFYMMLTALMFIPFALYMTDFSVPVNYGLKGPWLAAGIQAMNAIGALTLVYAFRHGKALVVSPLVNAGAPLLTSVIAMIVASAMPSGTKLAGIILALIAALLLALQPEETAQAAPTSHV
jgi:drug/metabolite transporter (DMT)-like permease